MEGFDQPLVVVFGGAGYIGSVLTHTLLEEGYRVRVFDNFLFGDHGIATIADPRLDVVCGDIADTFAVSNACRDADSVILLAAIIGRRANDIHRSNMREVNLLASSVVVDAAIEHGAARFLFASTDSIYGLQRGVMYETTTPEPVSLYSRLKLRMEERVLSRRHRDFHPIVLRIPTCHGYSPRMRFDLIANTMLREAVCNQRLQIEGGDQYRAIIHVQDVARAFVSCLQAHENLVSGEIFNVANQEQNLQIKSIAQTVSTLIPEIEVEISESATDLVDYHLSSAKIEKILDFKPAWSLLASLEQLQGKLAEEVFGNPFSLKYQNTW